MASLKELMGSAYNDNLSVDEIKAFFEGNEKIVNLSNGGYVAKGKYDEMNGKFKELTESTKDYEEIKTKYDELIAKSEKDGQLSTIKKFVSPEYAEFVHYQLKKNNQIDDNFEKNIQDYLNDNKQFSLKQEEPDNPDPIIVKTYKEMDGSGKNDNSAKESFNNLIRSIAGK